MTDTSGPAGFAERVDQIHVPEPNADRERLLLGVGIALDVLGVLLILGAYVGASGTSAVLDVLSYGISGGLLGLASIIIGSSLIIRFSLARLFRFWLARIVHEHQVQTDRTVEALGRIEAALLAGGAPAAPASPPPAAAESTDGHRVRREPLVADPLEK